MRHGAIWLLLAASLGQAEEVQRFQVWRTVGDYIGFGSTLLDVERDGKGSLVRYVYAGFVNRDTCGAPTVMEWESRIPGKTPAQLSKPANLCSVTQEQLNNMVRRGVLEIPFEADSESVHIYCGERDKLFGVPVVNANFDSPYVTLRNRILTAAFGRSQPNISILDREAERRGAEWVKLTAPIGRDDAGSLFSRYLREYRGPVTLAPPTWEFDFHPPVKLIRFGLLEGAYPPPPDGVYAVTLHLAVDRSSGKVLASTVLADMLRLTYWGIWQASLEAQFETASIPADGQVEVMVRHNPRCGTQDPRR